MHLIAEAGAMLAEVQKAADEAGRYFPLSLASEGTCTIGGNLSTNAGGVNVLRYGNARDLVLGLEVVLADGRVLELLRTLRKDNTGYDLKQLFIGAEGTLGVITAAALKLFPRPRTRVTAFAAVPDPAAAVSLLGRLQDVTGGLVSAFELIPRIGLEFVLAHIPGTADPLAMPAPWYVLIEATSAGDGAIKEMMEDGIGAALDAGEVGDAVIASSEAQRARAVAAARKHFGSAETRRRLDQARRLGAGEGHSGFSRNRRARLCRNACPASGRCRSAIWATATSISISACPRAATMRRSWRAGTRFRGCVHDVVWDFGGSISAEHGIGFMKRDEIAHYKSAAEIETMRALKRTLDPNNILNPGKVVAA